MNRRVIFLFAALGGVLLCLPSIANNYVLSVATLFLFFAYTGQAWNIMTGFAGQLSLGHSLYLGIGAYVSAALYFHFGIGPWAGLWLSIVFCGLVGAFVGALAFRYGISGVYFTLLTIAFAEFTRIGFDHWDWLGGSGGLFLKVTLILALAATALALSAWLLRSRAGYYWQAIRENEEAAQALGINTFRCKMLAVVTSAAMTSLAGVFSAFYYNNLFPEQIFSINRSIETILGPIIGGIGTLIGPILGAALLTLLADGVTELVAALGWEVAGVKQLIYGVILCAVVTLLPHGVWPTLARKLKVSR